MNKTELSDIIIFSGNLKELNSIDDKKQYKIIAPEFTSDILTISIYNSDNSIITNNGVRKNLLNKNYSGIIRAKTIKYGKSENTYFMIGIPVKLIESEIKKPEVPPLQTIREGKVPKYPPENW